MSFACTTGEVIQEFALTAEHEFRHGAPYIRIHRADYHNLLAVRAPRIKPDVIHLDHRVVGFVEPIFLNLTSRVAVLIVSSESFADTST